MAGRRTLFNEALKERMLKLYDKGATDSQVARNIGVSKRTIDNWKGKYPSFFHSLKEKKNIADDLVEATLFETALSGNTTAQIFWLKNRQPKRWRDKLTIESPEKKLTDEQLDAKINKLLAEKNGQNDET